ncbi:AraC family transcriptional regulator [Maridesulfovibrio sp. FT414]|uniref:AraC family transcriptional regulator n=1 Tax=Maridesulfovibrio sp. FT414 TaxID=2979469 RepID=UPI003D804705
MSTLLQPYNERMMEVLLHIQRNLDGDLSPERLSEIACFSVAHFHRTFKGMIGESLKEHVRRLRLERAAYKLCYTDLSVMDIALDARFESSETFSRAFKKRFKVPPSEYRGKSREMISPEGNGKIHYSPEPSVKGFKMDESPLQCEVDIRIREETRVAFIRHIGSYYDVMKAWDRLCSWGIGLDLLSESTEYLGLCYDDPDITPEGKIRYDACLSCQSEEDAPADIGFQIIPGGKYAVTTYYGAYSGLHDAYRELYGKWLPSSGYQIKNSLVSFEKYIKTSDDINSDDVVTEIWLGVY